MLQRVDALMSIYPDGHKRAAVIPLLDLAQRQHGWLPLTAMHEVARILSMPRMRVYEVATFYTMFMRSGVTQYRVELPIKFICFECLCLGYLLHIFDGYYKKVLVIMFATLAIYLPHCSVINFHIINL